MITVVAALIQSDGKLLVCQRKRGTSFAMMWEFPGGKVKPGETLEQALVRELKEELGAKATIGSEVYRTQHRYAELGDRLSWSFSRLMLIRAVCGIWFSKRFCGATRHRFRSLTSCLPIRS